MVQLWFIFLCLQNLSIFLAFAQESQSTIRDKIIDTKFEKKNYKQHERPDERFDKTTHVEVNIDIKSINSINVLNMEYSVDCILRQRWTDSRLAWNTTEEFKEFNDSIAIPSKKEELWLPDLFFRNGKKGHVHDMTQMNYLIRLYPWGEILFTQKISMNYTCQMHLQNFPMDVQKCHIDIGSYGYTYEQLAFYWRKVKPVEIPADLEIPEFSPQLNPEIQDCSSQTRTQTGQYTCLKAIFTLRRQLVTYVVNLYIPSILVVMTSWLSFWVHVEATPARVTLVLLTLLAILTQSMQLAASLPRVSYIKSIDVWVIACIIFVIGAIIEFAVANTLWRTTKERSIKKMELGTSLTSGSNLSRQHSALMSSNASRNKFASQMQNKSHPEELETLLTTKVEIKKPIVLPPPSESEVDAYSRFLFPACFILYNCFYWLYYFIIAKQVDKSS